MRDASRKAMSSFQWSCWGRGAALMKLRARRPPRRELALVRLVEGMGRITGYSFHGGYHTLLCSLWGRFFVTFGEVGLLI